MKAPGSTGTLPVMRAHYADILCQLAEDKGVSRQALLAAAGIRPSMLGHPENFITVDQFTALCRESLDRCGDDTLGLEFGNRLKFTTHGSLAQAAISCDNLEQALSVLIKYFRIRFAYMNLCFFTEADEAVLQLELGHEFADLYRFNIEVVMASLMDVNLLLFGQRLIEGGRCLLDFAEPADSSVYRSLFGQRLEFGCGVNQLRFQRRFLDLPMSLSNPVTRRVAEAQCEQEMRSIEAATSVSERVERALESARGGRLPGLEEIAGQMHVSPRTLRRQLASEGLRFQQLQDRLRHRRALELLGRKELGIDAIAETLGYSDPSNFSRAFRKWQGVSPGIWRSNPDGQVGDDHSSR
ncbi:AraC family transcriptional regulator [Marinobacter sp. M216]|uniref:AraC family transcriptional regulator n=1 Tax=Marinobacter albus TaxID=3030833 RepID=A0ABT7HFN4_9GAMM|nr:MULTISPECIES: AraC family transcriptional regulator [unclassified Marinobacter]MBW7472267.1 AraC family transcriptional regulator [Marinobacter sp. F4218]MDK9558837.1 AraC family transcriptional regulator [Marinobacter sp. M216]